MPSLQINNALSTLSGSTMTHGITKEPALDGVTKLKIVNGLIVGYE